MNLNIYEKKHFLVYSMYFLELDSRGFLNKSMLKIYVNNTC